MSNFFDDDPLKFTLKVFGFVLLVSALCWVFIFACLYVIAKMLGA